VQKVGFSLRDYIEMHGQQNVDVVTKYQWYLIFNNRAETKVCVTLYHVR